MKITSPSKIILLTNPFALFLVFVIWALILTYPLSLYTFSHIPLGDEPVGTVPLFNLWTLQWNIDQLMAGYQRYWDAPIFAPLTGTFAFSEIQPLSALLAAPLWLGLQSPPLGYNTVVILFLTLNGWFTYWLLKDWGGTPPGALLTAVIMQSLPFVAQEMGVLQLIAIFGFLWTLLFLSRFLSQQEQGFIHWPTMLGLALGVPVMFFTCGYYGLFSVLFLPLFFLFRLRRSHFRLQSLKWFAVVGALMLALGGPFLWIQQRHLAHYGFTRSDETIKAQSANSSYYTSVLDRNILYGRILEQSPTPGQHLFPGFGVALLACVGLFGSARRRIKLYLVLAILLAWLLSMGLHVQISELQPYQLVRSYIPGFGQLRSPFRFAVMVQIHLVLLAGLGLINLNRWFSNSRGWVATIAAGAAVVELLALPLPLQQVPLQQQRNPAAWQIWLNQQAPPVQVVMLPFAASNRVADFEQTVYWMLESRHFQGRMVNGYSGFFPRDHGHLRAQMLEFPTVEGIDLLRSMEVDYVVVHHNLANAPPDVAITKQLPLVYRDRQRNVSIFALTQPEANRRR